MHLPILARHERAVIIAKPAGMPVHKSRMAGRRGDWFVVQMARHELGRMVFPVHRLDVPTSGCLVLAFDGDMARELQAALSADGATKQYLAFVRGCVPQGAETTIERPLKSIDDPSKIQDAITDVRCLASSEQPRCSLLLANPRTGRFHQIRRHLAGIANPVLGDAKHGDSKVNQAWRAEWGMSGLGLHCWRLDLPLPDGERLSATCAPPSKLVDLWRRMPWWPDALAALPELDQELKLEPELP